MRIESWAVLFLLCLTLACGTTGNPTSDADGIGSLTPGGDPPGNLAAILFQAQGTEIAFPFNWIVTVESDSDARYGPIQVVTARGPRDSVGGVGYSAILWFSVPTALNSGVLADVTAFQDERNQDYLDRDGSLSAPQAVSVGGVNASQTVVDGRKRVPAHAAVRQTVETRITTTVMEAMISPLPGASLTMTDS